MSGDWKGVEGMVKRLLAVIAVILVIAPALVACGPAAGQEVANGVPIPPSANSVMKVKVDQIVTNPAVKAAYESLVKSHPDWPQTADAAFSQVLSKTGIDLTTVSSAIFFASMQSVSANQTAYAGVIATGSFKQSAVIDSIQASAKQKFTATDYKGFTVYAAAKDEYQISFLSSSQFVAGTPQAVHDTLDVKKGDQKALSGGVIDTLDRFGSPVITASFAVPQTMSSQLSKPVPGSPVSLSALQNVDNAGFSLDFQGLTINARIDAHFTSATSATDASNVITGLISLGKGGAQDPGTKAALGNIQVTTSESWLSVRSTLDATQMASLAGTFQPKN
jgi:hypothetical protein